jgi:glycosyltransferase involved in cell wall biosynthesis
MGVLPGRPEQQAMSGLVGTAWNLAVHQAANGHRVEIVSPTRQSQPVFEQICGVTIIRLPLRSFLRNRRYDLSYLLPLRLFSRKADLADISHVHGNPFFLLPRHSRASVIHYQNSPLSRNRNYVRMVNQARIVICCSEFIRQEFFEWVPFPEDRTRVIYNGVNLANMNITDRPAARKSLGISDDHVIVFFAGRIIPDKGASVLLQAFREVVQSSTVNVQLLLAGTSRLGFADGEQLYPELAAYDRMVHQLSDGLPVRFLGDLPANTLFAYLQAADIFVCPSVFPDPFPLVNVEAMAAGLPVIASDIGGIPEIVLDGFNGLLAKAGAPDVLALAIDQLIKQPALRAQMGINAQSSVSKYDWAMIDEKVVQVYQEALA